MKISRYFGNLGTNYMYSYYDLTKNGLPKHLGDLYYETSYYLATNTDLVFTAYDKSGALAGDLKVAARTIIQVIAFDTESNMLYVNVYSGKTGEYGYASIEMQKDDTWKVGGVPVDDAFLGIRYAG